MKFNKVKFKIFDILEKEIDKAIAQYWFKNFTPIESCSWSLNPNAPPD